MKLGNLVVVALALILGFTSVNAQQKQPKTAAERAEMHTARMQKILNLEETQRAKVAEINLGVAMKNDAIRNDVNMTKEMKKEAIEANKSARKSMLKAVLDEEQIAKLEARESKMNEKKTGKKTGKKVKPTRENTEEILEEL
jgi:nicotinamide mononucleotide adenylyltransferase